MIDNSESKAFVQVFEIPPYRLGKLSGLTFGVKDLIDIEGYKTGGGNPTWENSHPPATCHAICVEQLLSHGAICKGKTTLDELAYSLLGENFFYGTPLNPKAPDRVPGGSSSGSASAVACGQVDFALGTDTGGSVRVPANNCGIVGFRPSHGRISLAGVVPFAPSFDTVGIFAKTEKICADVARVLLANEKKRGALKEVLILRDAFAMSDKEVQAALEPVLKQIRQRYPCREVVLEEIFGQGVTFETLRKIYRTLQWAEVWSSLGAWIEDVRPSFGSLIAANFESAKKCDRTQIADAIQKREEIKNKFNTFLGESSLLCLPTRALLAPKKGSVSIHSPGNHTSTPSFTPLAGLASSPELTLPYGHSQEGVPVGISFLASQGNDELLLQQFEDGFD
jgi:amidase